MQELGTRKGNSLVRHKQAPCMLHPYDLRMPRPRHWRLVATCRCPLAPALPRLISPCLPACMHKSVIPRCVHARLLCHSCCAARPRGGRVGRWRPPHRRFHRQQQRRPGRPGLGISLTLTPGLLHQHVLCRGPPRPARYAGVVSLQAASVICCNACGFVPKPWAWTHLFPLVWRCDAC